MTTKQSLSIENSYWEGNGKHEKELQELNGQLPDWGMTDNQNMNLFIMASNIYYDIYNNDGCNLMDLDKIQKYILPFAKEIKSIRFNVKRETLIKNLKKEIKLEAFLDEVILCLKDKNLEYDKQVLFFDNSKEELSRTFIEGFSRITFGTKSSCDEWVDYRLSNMQFKWLDK